MADYQGHISFSTFVAIGYALLGVYVLGIYPEYILLASVLVVITGMLPNVDAAGGAPARELGGLLAAITPLVVLSQFPSLEAGGIARIALVVIASYLLTRILVVRLLEKITVHRGVFHSVPAAIIVFEIVYLLFWDLYLLDRLFIAAAAFIGFFSHLLLDAYGNLDIVGTALGKPKKKARVIKFGGSTWGATIALYSCVLFLGYFVARDFYPGLPRLPHISIF